MTYNQLQLYFFLTLLAGNLVLSFFLFKPFLGALVLAATFAVIFDPLYRQLRTAVRYESLAAILTIAIVVIIVIAPLIWFGLQIFNQARDLYIEVARNNTDFTTQLTQIGEERVASIFPRLTVNVNEYIRQGTSWLLQHLGTVFSSATQMVISFLLSLLALFYLLKDGPHFRKTIIGLSPLLDRYDKTIFERLHNAVNSVVKGSLAIALLQGLSTGIGFALFGVPQSALWGSVAVIAALIPNVGTALVVTPGVIYLFLTDHLLASAGLAIWGVTAVGLIDNLLGPKLIQRGLQIHPLLILLAVLGGLSMFGPIGFLVGPIILSLLFALLDIYKVLILKDS